MSYPGLTWVNGIVYSDNKVIPGSVRTTSWGGTNFYPTDILA